MSWRPADVHGDYVLRHLGLRNAGDVQLYLSPKLADELHEESKRADLVAFEAEQQIREQRRQERLSAEQLLDAPTKKKNPSEPSIGAHAAHPLEFRQHKVFVDADAILARLRDLRAGAQGDRDHAKREELALSRAIERGPYRSIVRPAEWRAAFDELALELPAFRRAIELIRNAQALSVTTGSAPLIPPLLLVGPPGVGKSHFCRRLAEILQAESKWIALDQPSAGSQLCGSDRAWGNSRHGALFELLALGKMANPLVVLDEIDKSARSLYSQEVDPLAQLYSALEPETARRLSDISLDIELDTSQVVYIATANSLKTLDSALLSRFEVMMIGLPAESERRESAARIVAAGLVRLGAIGQVAVSPGAVVVLADFTPRVMSRAVEKAVAAAVMGGQRIVRAEDIEQALGLSQKTSPAPATSKLH
jgi:ATP-dependent Lon protease